MNYSSVVELLDVVVEDRGIGVCFQEGAKYFSFLDIFNIGFVVYPMDLFPGSREIRA
jgi:hypothetical protein